MSDVNAKRIFRELQSLARADYGANTGNLLVVYAVEGFLRRLAASDYASSMTLKGGMLMAAMASRRMTKDADLSAVGVANDQARVAAVVREILAVPLAREDGLVFDADSIRTEVMREEAEYHGVRVRVLARLATARVTVTLDFSFGDLNRSTIIDLPELLGSGTIRLAAYPPEMTVAEKVATMMSRRELNTRDRDFADVWILSRVQPFSAPELRASIHEVAEHRGHAVIVLAEALADMPDRERPYAAMVNRMGFQHAPPASWKQLLADVRAFIDPLIADTAGRLRRWDRANLRWDP